ncbi:MAG TPA: carboxypeptidase-like regulatory domain-containing protein [Bryobacteraceae bacterium]|nr:carboxypeptidase-like regulatory domain-containing protein [Bryobacteraceae bacterium]
MAAVLGTAGMVFAQSTTATLNGTVTDSAGAVIVDAQVSITNQATRITVKTNTSADGTYSMPGLSSATYEVTVSKAGFASLTQTGIFLGPTVVRTVNATLSVGQVSQQVTVEAAVDQVQTTTGEVSNSVAQQQVETLPLNGRNYQSLSALMPGVLNTAQGNAQGQGGFGTGNTMSINGMGLSGTLYELDGVWNMNTGNMTQTTILPNPDSIQEVRTLQNNISPKYTLLGASVVLVQTRSGSRELHGSAWEYFRNTDLNSRNFFAPEVSPYHQNIFGGTIGGPLFIPRVFNKDKNKTFFFISEQGTRQSIASTQQGLTPTADQRAGLFSKPINDPLTAVNGDPTTAKPFPTNAAGQYVIPSSRIQPDALTLLNATANLPNYASGANNYINTNPQVTNQLDSQVKVDHNLNDKIHLMGEYFDLRQTQQLSSQAWLGSPFTTSRQSFDTRSKLVELQGTVIISPTMVNQLSLGANIYVVDLGTSGLVYQEQLPDFHTDLPYSGFLSNRLPQVSFAGGYASIGVTQTQPLIHASDLETTLTDDWSWVKGQHTIEAGFNLVNSTKRQNKFAQSNGTWNFSGRFTGDSVADYLLGDAESFYQESTERRPYIHGRIMAGYIQDSWKATKNLTVNYGLRISYMPMPQAQNRFEAMFYPATYDPAHAPVVNNDGTITPTANYNPTNGIVVNGENGIPQNFAYGQKWYLAPTAGFAWNVFGDGKTSLRGGYGSTQTRVFTGADCTYDCANNYPFVQSITLNHPQFPNPIGTGAAAPPGAPNLSNIDLWSKSAATIYTYSLTLEHQFPGWLVAVGGAGNHSENMPLSLDMNQPGPTGGYDYNPAINAGAYEYLYGQYLGYANLSTKQSLGRANWNALTVSARHSVGHGLFFTGAYTFSHGLSNAFSQSFFGSTGVQNSLNPDADYGNSAVDVTHVLSFSYIWDIPFMKNATGFNRTVLGGWKYSGITAIQSGISLSPGLSISNAGLANKPDATGQSMSYPKTIAQWFNTGAFTSPLPGFFGNAANGSIRGPGLVTFDMALYKDFRFGERHTIQFRGELFNIFNHTNFSGVNTSYGSSGYGNITSSLDPRIVEFALRYHF